MATGADARPGPPRRILVVGCCGAGKSTFARRLAAATDLPLIHLAQRPPGVALHRPTSDRAADACLTALAARVRGQP